MHTTMRPKQYQLNQSPFFKLRSRRKLAEVLRISLADLNATLKKIDFSYNTFETEKKSGGTRIVENPRKNLKLLQTRVATLLSRIAPPNYLFCPVKGRCYVTNADQHRNNRIIRCLDVRKYFPSTSSRKVYWFFHDVMLCSPDVAAMLARLATYNGYLPTGSPLSPIMAYFAHYDLWQSIADICSKNGYTLTVYIDDVTISGPTLSAAAIWKIKKLIHRHGLQYHKEKIYVDRPAEVTGVIVRNGRLLVPNRQLAKLYRARREFLDSGDQDQKSHIATQISGLEGQINQVARHG
ncbi:reverse transcriptase family protein [Inquilinus limosus]|uniref:reverse transcriptase family protein n=1 Tax=Inquilinus limosus TaxID=171674 RepID=UPI001B7FBC42